VFRTCATLLILFVFAFGPATASPGKDRSAAEVPIVKSAGPICAKGKPNAYPRLLSKGVSIKLYLVGPYVGDASLPVSQNYREKYDITVVDISGASVNSSIVVVTGRELATSSETLDKQLADICAPWMTTKFRVNDVGFQDILYRNAEAALKQQQLAEERQAKERVAAEAAQALLSKLRAVPTIEELDVVLKPNWQNLQGAFPPAMADTTFGRVHDARCTMRSSGERFDCLVGVTAESARGPEYEQGDLECSRSGQGELNCSELQIMTTPLLRGPRPLPIKP
jgi:hypothetical protein